MTALNIFAASVFVLGAAAGWISRNDRDMNAQLMEDMRRNRKGAHAR